MSRKELHGERGAVLVIVAVAIVVLIGIAALALDVGQMYVARQRAQNVCDAAAMAGAYFLTGDSSCTASDGLATTVAVQCALGNNEMTPSWHVLVPGTTDQGVEVTFPSGTVTDDAGRPVTVALGEAIRARGFVTANFSFAQILGFSSKDVSASATAVVQPAKGFCTDLYVPLSVSSETILGVPGTSAPISFGPNEPPVTLHIVNPNDINNFLGPGNFLSVRFGSESGGDDYRDRLKGNAPSTCVDTDPASIEVSTEPGAMIGPTAQGISARLAKDTLFTNDATAWSDWLNAYDEDTGKFPYTPRLAIIPIIYDQPEAVRGQKPLAVLGFAAFFIEHMDSKNDVVLGHFVQGVVGPLGSVNWIFPVNESPNIPNTLSSVNLVS